MPGIIRISYNPYFTCRGRFVALSMRVESEGVGVRVRAVRRWWDERTGCVGWEKKV
jgi:hypothetical protein